LLSRLERIGALDTTMIVFLNDNGQDGKGTIYESGTLCPGLIWRKGGFPCGPRLASLVTNLDIAPTILDFAGVAAIDAGFDGASLRPLLEGRATSVRDHAYFEIGFARGIVHDGFKYIATRIPASAPDHLDFRRNGAGGRGGGRGGGRDPDGRYGHLAGGPMEQIARRQHPAYDAPDQLYQLATDPDERNNLVGKARHAERLAHLKDLLRQELARLPGEFGEFSATAQGANAGGE
jgi:arylsulfatase A-like enzyme